MRCGIPLESPESALFQRKGGFLFSERWLAQNGTVALFARTMHQTAADWKALCLVGVIVHAREVVFEVVDLSDRRVTVGNGVGPSAHLLGDLQGLTVQKHVSPSRVGYLCPAWIGE